MNRILSVALLALVLSGALAFAQTTTQPSTQPDSTAAPQHHAFHPQTQPAA